MLTTDRQTGGPTRDRQTDWVLTSDTQTDGLLQGLLRTHLSYPVGAVHGLQVPHGVPVVLHEHHGVRPRQVKPQAPHVGGEQQHVDGRVVVEPGRGVAWRGGGGERTESIQSMRSQNPKNPSGGLAEMRWNKRGYLHVGLTIM